MKNSHLQRCAFGESRSRSSFADDSILTERQSSEGRVVTKDGKHNSVDADYK